MQLTENVSRETIAMTDHLLTDDNTSQANKPSRSKDGHVYRDKSERMKYQMRRIRNSPLPHYPEHETANAANECKVD